MSWSDRVFRLPEPQHFYFDLYLSCHVVPFWMFLPLLHLRKRPVEQPARLRASWVCLRVCVSLRLCRQTGCQIHRRRGGKPCHSHLLWFRSPHILSYILSHPPSAAAAAALRMCFFVFCFFAQRPPKSHFPPHHTLFTWNPAFLGNYVMLHFFFLDCFWEQKWSLEKKCKT